MPFLVTYATTLYLRALTKAALSASCLGKAGFLISGIVCLNQLTWQMRRHIVHVKAEKGRKQTVQYLATLALLKLTDVLVHNLGRSNKMVSFYTFKLNFIPLDWSLVWCDLVVGSRLLFGKSLLKSILGHTVYLTTFSQRFYQQV